MNKKLVVLGMLCASLAACGGDDGEPTPTPTPQASPEGFWTGRASTGTDVYLAVLEDGKTWGFYQSGGYVVGALIGQTSYSGTSLSGSGKDFNLLSRTVSPGTYSGNFAAKSYVNVSLSNGSTFTGNYDSWYDQPASQAAVVGTFNGQGVTGTTLPQAATISVTSSGQVTMSPVQGCGASGSLRPRASGKNVYDVAITFQGSTCVLGNGATVRGIAIYDATNRALWALAANSAQTDGFIYAAVKN